MIINGKDVGKQLITANGKWDATKPYKRLCIVYKDGNSYLSKTAVPAGTSLADEDYWQPFHSLDAALAIDLSEYKAQLQEKIDTLTEAVTISINTNNTDVENNISKVLARLASVEENSNSSLNNVIQQLSQGLKEIRDELNAIKTNAENNDNTSKERDEVINNDIKKQYDLLVNYTNTAIKNLESKLANYATVDQIQIQPQALATFAERNGKLDGATRVIVAKDVDRDSISSEDVAVGYEVYVIETKLTYIIDEISITGDITYSLHIGSTIDAEYFDQFDGELPETIADRAISDELGNKIIDTYIRKSDILNYIEDTVKRMFIDNMPIIYPGSITPEMLSEATLQLLGNKTITNLPDDFTLAVNKDRRIGLADLEPNVGNFRSWGHRHLRANIIDCKNVLEQYMVDTPNMFYYVYLNYDLNGQTIILPDNIKLVWKGGSFNNGTIKGVIDDIMLKGSNLIVEPKE